MAEQETPTLRKVAWTELLPWLNLVRCFRIAIQVRLLVAAALGAVLMVGGWAVLGYLFAGNDRIATEFQPSRGNPWLALTDEAIPDEPGTLPAAMVGPDSVLPPVGQRSLRPAQEFWGSFPSFAPFWGAWEHLSGPWQKIFTFGPGSLKFMDRLTRSVFLLCCGLWALAVWALFGGVITRAAAVELATFDRAKTGRTIRFVASKWRAYFAAPFFPLVGVLLLGVPIAVLGLFLRTGVTLWIAAVFWPLALVTAFLMALLLLGLLFGWPLMFANISVEGVDSFDAVGRAYNYVFQRPLQYLFYAMVAAVLGALGWLLVWNFAAAVAGLSYGAAAWGGGCVRTEFVARVSGELGVVGAAAAWLIRFWVQCVKLLGVGFLYSYFFAASTAIYFLLRRDADATELDEVCPEEEEQKPAESPAPAPSESAGAQEPAAKLPDNQAE